MSIIIIMKNHGFEQNNPEEVDEIDLNQIQVFDGYDNTLSMRRLPWSLWTLSILATFTASFLLANLLGAHIFKAYNQRIWWQYFIIVILYVFGIVVFLFGKVEVVKFDKNSGIFEEAKWILCYKWKGFRTEISDIVNVTLQKEGKKNEFDDSIHYKVLVSFKQFPPLRILETKNQARAIEKVKEIRDFLGIQGSISIRDLSDA